MTLLSLRHYPGIPPSGSTVVITGGARGIGRATAELFHRRGATVHLGDIDAELAGEVAEAIGPNVHAAHLDVTSTHSWQTFVDGVLAESGQVDVLVNNAGVMPLGAFDREDDAISHLTLNVNIAGPMNGMKTVLPLMVAAGHGHVVNVASMAGKLPIPGMVVYNASKYGAVGLSAGARSEYARSGVSISAILPSAVRTELSSGVSLGGGLPTVDPEDVAEAVVATIRHRRAKTTVPPLPRRLEPRAGIRARGHHGRGAPGDRRPPGPRRHRRGRPTGLHRPRVQAGALSSEESHVRSTSRTARGQRCGSALVDRRVGGTQRSRGGDRSPRPRDVRPALGRQLDQQSVGRVVGGRPVVAPVPRRPAAVVSMIITPHRGSTVRVHLTNRFGSATVTFDHVTIAQRSAGAALVPGTTQEVTFDGGSTSVTVPAKEDVVSEPVEFAFEAFDDVAVSFFLESGPLLPTEHFTARQTSYYTSIGAGDHAADPSDAAFANPTTSRYFVSGLDVRAPGRTGSVMAFGDSLTDGFQGPTTLVPENATTLDTNGRWPDVVQRRLDAADIPLSMLNAGISGNRVLQNGFIPQFGPSGLSRFPADALDQAGVSTVVVLEGTNDLGQGLPTFEQMKAGYEQFIEMAHTADEKILLGALPPAGGAFPPSYGSPFFNQTRNKINEWITSGNSGAGGHVDFNAAVADPTNPDRIAPEFDGGDKLHFNLADYQAMADAVSLSALRVPACSDDPDGSGGGDYSDDPDGSGPGSDATPRTATRTPQTIRHRPPPMLRTRPTRIFPTRVHTMAW